MGNLRDPTPDVKQHTRIPQHLTLPFPCSLLDPIWHTSISTSVSAMSMVSVSMSVRPYRSSGSAVRVIRP